MSIFNSISQAWGKLGPATQFGVAAGGAQMLLGGIDSIFANQEREKAQKELELQANKNPFATASPSLNEYYQKALANVNQNPYTSASYLNAQKNALRSLAYRSQIGQDVGATVAGAGKAAAQYSDTMGNAYGQAENISRANMGQFGQAAQLKSNEDRYLFDVNQLTPYNRRFGLAQMKAQAANERFRNSLGTLTGGLSNVASIGAAAYKPSYTPPAQPQISFEGEK